MGKGKFNTHKKILIPDASNADDICLLTQALRDLYPDREIYGITDPLQAPLFIEKGILDKAYPKPPSFLKLKPFSSYLRELRNRNFDAIAFSANSGLSPIKYSLILSADARELLVLSRSRWHRYKPGIGCLAILSKSHLPGILLSLISVILFIFLLVALGGVEIIIALRRKSFSQSPVPQIPPPSVDCIGSISFVIPNYNGISTGVIERCLKSLRQADGVLKADNEIIVVDDASTDNSVGFIRRTYPGVRLILNEVNQGYLLSADRGIRAAKGEVIVLLNSDCLVEKGFLAPLVETLFNHQYVGFASPILLDQDGKRLQWGVSFGHLANGRFYTWNQAEVPGLDFISSINNYTIYCIGGALAFKKELYTTLGGFWKAYSPGTWEDIDLCYSAWKAGYESVVVPASRAIHLHHETIVKTSKTREYADTHNRNSYLFTWRNLSYKTLIKKVLPQSIKALFIAGLRGELSHLYAFFNAYQRTPQLLYKRNRYYPLYSNEDKDIMSMIKDEFSLSQAKDYIQNHRLRVLALSYKPKKFTFRLLDELASHCDVELIAIIDDDSEPIKSDRFKTHLLKESIIHPPERTKWYMPFYARSLLAEEVALLIDYIREKKGIDLFFCDSVISASAILHRKDIPSFTINDIREITFDAWFEGSIPVKSSLLDHYRYAIFVNKVVNNSSNFSYFQIQPDDNSSYYSDILVLKDWMEMPEFASRIAQLIACTLIEHKNHKLWGGIFV